MAAKLGILIFLFVICNVVLSDDVPAILWNIKGNSLHAKPVSALGHNDKVFTDSLNDILHQDSKILVYSLNELSLEEFSTNDKPASSNSTLYNLQTFLDFQPHMLLPSVKNPLSYIHKAHCGVQEIIVDQAMDSAVFQSISLAFEQSCVVILHIPDEGIIAKKGGNLEEIKKSFLPSLEKPKNIVGIFTSMKSSLGIADNDHHVFRNLLAIDDPDSKFINVSNCIIMYVENATLKIGKEANNTIVLPLPVSTEGSQCSNSTAMLQLNFKPSESVSSVILKFSFLKKGGSWETKATLSLKGDKLPEDALNLYSDMIGAPLGFSFSCGKANFGAKNVSQPIVVSFDRFQIQPYEIKNGIFSDSFDCVPFFTIPIWMGIFISILFIVIMNIGIYALFSVHTMDRFDDPKGKTITVATTGD